MSDHYANSSNSPDLYRSPVFVFAVEACVLAVGLTLFAVATMASAGWVVLMFTAICLVAGSGLALTYPHAELGLCNTATLVRAALVAWLFGALFAVGVMSPWWVFAVGTVALALDGVDGWLARSAGLQSAFGARFDMETDAGLGAVLALWLLLSGTTGPEVLVLGFMRYAFVVASWRIPALRAPLPPSFRRKIICVIQIGALLGLTCPLLPSMLILPVSIAAAMALTYSFAVDILWLLRKSR